MIRGLLISLIVERALESFSQALSVGFKLTTLDDEMLELTLGEAVEIDGSEYDAFDQYLATFKCYLDIEESSTYIDDYGNFHEVIYGNIAELP